MKLKGEGARRSKYEKEIEGGSSRRWRGEEEGIIRIKNSLEEEKS